MALVDTSVWIEIFRDRTGRRRPVLSRALAGDDVTLCRFTQLELLQGARDEREWSLLKSYLDTQDYLDMATGAWERAARTAYDLRRRGLTVRSPIDCCIAQIALDHDTLLVHCDRDFEAIAAVRPLRQTQVRW